MGQLLIKIDRELTKNPLPLSKKNLIFNQKSLSVKSTKMDIFNKLNEELKKTKGKTIQNYDEEPQKTKIKLLF